MSRIDRKFEQLKTQRRAALVTYVMTCDPTPELSQDIINLLPSAGADIIELGMAFSDPTADGPTIQEAAIRGLAAGATLVRTLEILYNFRQKDQDTPVILMGYYNPILKYGIKEFCNDAALAGADGFIIVDLPPEEDSDLLEAAKAHGLSMIRLIAPTTDNDRLQTLLKDASGFVYYISMAGVTGTKSVNPSTVVPYVTNIKKFTNLPVAVGFGIKSPEHVKEIGKYADAVVVGSSLVSLISNYVKAYSSKSSPIQLKENIRNYIKSLAAAL